MISRRIALLTAVAATAACRSDQPLALDSTTSSHGVPASGGVVSSPAGASVTFPAGSVGAGAQVSVSVTAPSAAARAAGTSLAGSVVVDGAGAVLTAPASMDERLSSSTATRDSAWLATFVLERGGRVTPITRVQVDLLDGIAHASLPSFGTVTPVIPHRNQILVIAGAGLVHSRLASLVPGGARPAVSVASAVRSIAAPTCGFYDASGNWAPCPVDATISGNLTTNFGTVALINGVVQDTLLIAGDPRVAGGAPVSGQIAVSGDVRGDLHDANGIYTETISNFSNFVLATTASSTAEQTGTGIVLHNVVITLADAVHSSQQPQDVTLTFVDAQTVQLTYTQSATAADGTAQGSGTMHATLNLGF